MCDGPRRNVEQSAFHRVPAVCNAYVDPPLAQSPSHDQAEVLLEWTEDAHVQWAKAVREVGGQAEQMDVVVDEPLDGLQPRLVGPIAIDQNDLRPRAAML
jgi:hypothetical protein